MKSVADSGVTTPVCHLESAFLSAITAAGLDYQGPIIADGALHRFKANGDPNPNSFYTLHLDHPAAGIFGCWRRGTKETWCAVGTESLTESERAERDRRWKQQQAEREAERRRYQAEAATKAQAILDAARPATDDHPYLVKKAVKAAPGLMTGAWPQGRREGCLLIPLRNAAGQLATIQAIADAPFAHGSNKDFLKGGAKTGSYVVIGDLESSPIILLAEGYATAATLHAATGYAAVMCCDAGNLKPVAMAMKTLYPSKPRLICGDNDRNTEGNPGVKAAQAAAKASWSRVVAPQLSDDEAGTDFNDLAALHGLDVVKVAIAAAAVTPAKAKATAKPATKCDPYRGSDDANADLLLELHGLDMRFCPPWGKWMLWTGSHWRIDDRLDVKHKAEDVCRELYRRAAAASDLDERKKIAALAWTLESCGSRGAMLSAAQHKVVVHHSDLDKGHFLLNASNGTLNLSTGKLHPHDRADLLTHDTEIIYSPNAAAPAWKSFLKTTLVDDALIQFVQRAVGYSLTGDVREQIMLIVTGVGSNGKSVFLNILRKLLGTLAIQAAPDLLMVARSEKHPTDQADLFGKRLVVCQETGEGRRFNETLVKQLTGGDGIRARRMREDFWEFNPTHKLWLSTNHKPEIRGTDHAIWRRIRIIPFNVKFTDDGPARKDPDMEAKLTAELPGILAWAVQGYLDWQREGLKAPAAVIEATEGYRAEMDVLAAFFADCCFIGKRAETKAADIYRAYSLWCEQSGEHAETQRKFGMRLSDREFRREARRDGIYYLGIGLLDRRYESEPCEPCEPEIPINRNSEFHEGVNRKTGSQGSQGSRTHKPTPQAPDPALPVDSTLTGDAATLAGVLKHYRGWAELGELARKTGLGSMERTMAAAQGLAAQGLAEISGDMIKPAARLTGGAA